MPDANAVHVIQVAAKDALEWIDKEKLIQAIKSVRATTGWGLKDAKSFVLGLQKGMTPEQACAGVSVAALDALGMKVPKIILSDAIMKVALEEKSGVSFMVMDHPDGSGDFVVMAVDGKTVFAEIPVRVAKAIIADPDTQLVDMVHGQVVKAYMAWAKPSPKGKEANMAINPGQFPLDQLTYADPIKLSDATSLYQPVRGSGSGSRYFVVGICKDLKVAARIKGDSISVRVEGSGLEDEGIRSHVKEVGFNNVDEAYGSFHVQAKGETLQAKAIGATLLALSSSGWVTPLPDVSVFANMGS